MTFFDLEQLILRAWGTCEDIDDIRKCLMDFEERMSEDELDNALLGIRTMHEMRMRVLFNSYETMLKEQAVAKKQQQDNSSTITVTSYDDGYDWIPDNNMGS